MFEKNTDPQNWVMGRFGKSWVSQLVYPEYGIFSRKEGLPGIYQGVGYNSTAFPKIPGTVVGEIERMSFSARG